MAGIPPCDNDHGVESIMSITSFATSDTNFWCGPCGVSLILELAGQVWPDMIIDKAAELAPPAPASTPVAGGDTQPTGDPPAPAKSRSRRSREVHVPPIDFDEHRTIAEVVEDQPRPPGSGPVPAEESGEADDGDLADKHELADWGNDYPDAG